MTTAFVFPGQGSWRPDALAPWEGHPAAAVLDDVSAGLGRDVREVAAAPDTGTRTADAQPAILAASLVAWRALTDRGLEPAVVAGHSLGEITAAVAAGALTPADAARVVQARGAAMGEACRKNPGTMAALVRLSEDEVARVVDGIDDLVLANDNAPGQAVVAGPEEAVAEAGRRARELGGRSLPVEVEGAFHSPAMAGALDPVDEVLATVDVAAPSLPFISGRSVEPLHSGAEVREAVVAGIRAPVRWREVQAALTERGVTTLVEVGPGGVLKGLARRTIPEVEVLTVAGPDDMDAVTERVPAGSR